MQHDNIFDITCQNLNGETDMTEKLTSSEKRVNAYFSILKVLLREGVASKQRISELVPGSRSTISKRIEELKEERIVVIEKGARGPVGTHNCILTFKGLYYLFVNKKLHGKDLQIGIRKLFDEVGFSKNKYLRQQNFENVVRIAIEDSAKSVNLEYFDEKLVKELLFRSLQQKLTLEISADSRVREEIAKPLLSPIGHQYRNELIQISRDLLLDNKRVIKTLEKENRKLKQFIGILQDREFKQKVRSMLRANK